MLVHLHAAGNIHYAKSVHLYLQNMSKLKTTLSDQEFERFVSQGYFTVRRSDQFWCGFWTDMTVEQVLMRSMKVIGGLKKGRKMSDSFLACWIFTMPGSLQVTEAMEAFIGVTGVSSDQHISLQKSWQTRDFSDFKKV
ncbi:hypothetical protein AVEN_48269-1 [Araneus ventricosus]|uniref:Uncharacterized protein n=1 Tax=Araneus ventricosus TaxID=182803 RepID=A0A4Y2ENS2_ARAVE|nr:hypothetical protein AVEN_48269-1 [Araneus ventricosus]